MATSPVLWILFSRCRTFCDSIGLRIILTFHFRPEIRPRVIMFIFYSRTIFFRTMLLHLALVLGRYFLYWRTLFRLSTSIFSLDQIRPRIARFWITSLRYMERRLCIYRSSSFNDGISFRSFIISILCRFRYILGQGIALYLLMPPSVRVRRLYSADVKSAFPFLLLNTFITTLSSTLWCFDVWYTGAALLLLLKSRFILPCL